MKSPYACRRESRALGDKSNPRFVVTSLRALLPAIFTFLVAEAGLTTAGDRYGLKPRLS